MSISEHLTTSLGRTVRLSAAALVLLTLGACGDDTSAAPAAGDQTDTGTRPGYSAPASPATDDVPELPPVDPPSATPTTAEPESPTSTPTDDPDDAPELITYAGGEAETPLIESSADARKLTGAPVDFQEFIGRLADKVSASADCDGAAVGITVDVLRTDGFAAGGVNECGGYAAMWAKVDGTWKEIQGTQDEWDCGPLRRYQVPSSILLGRQVCYDYEGDMKEHAYQQA